MPVVLQANDPILKAFLNFDIKPCVAEQILKFCCIELPSELGYLNLNYSGDPDNNNAVDPQRQERVERLSQILGLVEHEQNTNPDFLTIGECYAGIIDKFWELSDVEKKLDDPNAKLFTGDSRKQFTYFGL